MASGVLTGVRLGALRTVAGNGGAWEGSRCAYRCPVEGIAHGSRQLRGLRGLPVCLLVFDWGHCARLPASQWPVRTNGVTNEQVLFYYSLEHRYIWTSSHMRRLI